MSKNKKPNGLPTLKELVKKSKHEVHEELQLGGELPNVRPDNAIYEVGFMCCTRTWLI